MLIKSPRLRSFAQTLVCDNNSPRLTCDMRRSASDLVFGRRLNRYDEHKVSSAEKEQVNIEQEKRMTNGRFFKVRVVEGYGG